MTIYREVTAGEDFKKGDFVFISDEGIALKSNRKKKRRKTKKYKVYTWPAMWELQGKTKYFRFYISALIYAFFKSGVSELENTKTGEYKAYWM